MPTRLFGCDQQPSALETHQEDRRGAGRHRAIAGDRRLRTNFPETYPATADRVEAELGLRDAKIPGDGLGSIDTFRFEERVLLAYCGDLVAAKQFDRALAIIGGREHSFWLDRGSCQIHRRHPARYGHGAIRP
jgi:hypothetical protein